MIRSGFALLLLASAAVGAEEPQLSVEQIVQRAAQVEAKKPEGTLVCKAETEAESLDSDGKRKSDTRTESEWTFMDGKQNTAVIRQWQDGKELTQQELVAQEKEQAKETEKAKAKEKGTDVHFEIKPPLDAAADYRFALLRTEPLAGQRALVLSAAPRDEEKAGWKGTLWIDAESFVQLKAELVATKSPDPHVDWMKMQLEQRLLPGGASVPALMVIEGAGHFLFFHMGFRSTERVGECRATTATSHAAEH